MNIMTPALVNCLPGKVEHVFIVGCLVARYLAKLRPSYADSRSTLPFSRLDSKSQTLHHVLSYTHSTSSVISLKKTSTIWVH